MKAISIALVLIAALSGAAVARDGHGEGGRDGQRGGFGKALSSTSTTAYLIADLRVEPAQQQRTFVATHMTPLWADLARGEGEHLRALAGLFGCPAAVAPEFMAHTGRNFSAIVPESDPTPAALLASIKTATQGHPRLARSCQHIS